MPVQEVLGDLLEPGNWYAIAHQINSRCVKPHGLSAAVAALGRGCHYGRRRPQGSRNLAIELDRPPMGSIDVLGDPDDHTRPKSYIIIGLMAQLDYGTAGVKRPIAHPAPTLPSIVCDGSTRHWIQPANIALSTTSTRLRCLTRSDVDWVAAIGGVPGDH